MQTIYLLKGCNRSHQALISLYNFPDISNNIIIVDKLQSRILLLDKRVTKFPFIINTLPTSTGLIPEIAYVLPLKIFLKFHRHYNQTETVKPKYSRRIHNMYTKPKILNKPIIKRINKSDGGVEIRLE